MTLLITGGAGFIGSNFAKHCVENYNGTIVILDKFTYAAQPLENFLQPCPKIVVTDINDSDTVQKLMVEESIETVVHFAAETHVDNSIANIDPFIESNILGTNALLSTALKHYQKLDPVKKKKFRFLHVSTDEVFGSLNAIGDPFTEHSPFRPNNPYSASKASSDHLVRAYYKTYGLPTITVNMSNCYGPRQNKEKLVPKTISRILEGADIPIYGRGLQIRDWNFVEDAVSGIFKLIYDGTCGETYNIGGGNEIQNIDLVKMLLNLSTEFDLNELSFNSPKIVFVDDRPGHDFRYACDFTKIRELTGWFPKTTLSDGLRKTFTWYLANKSNLGQSKA